jgi:FAD/FMN-containing dehydrogenase
MGAAGNWVPSFVASISQAAARGQRLEVRGGGTKSAIGRPGRDTTLLQIQGFDTVIDYDGPELVLTAGASTPLAKIEALLAQNNQMLAFEPFDHAVLFGLAPAATLGGVIAAGVSGSRRLTAGAVRDHFLGLRGVSGRGEDFMGGAKVVKNVTGYDLPKLLANSWGQLAVMTEVTLKVLPRPQTVQTVVLSGLNERQACLVMGQALGSQADVAAAAHLPSAAAVPSTTPSDAPAPAAATAAAAAAVVAAAAAAAAAAASSTSARDLEARRRLRRRLRGRQDFWRAKDGVVDAAPEGVHGTYDGLAMFCSGLGHEGLLVCAAQGLGLAAHLAAAARAGRLQ